MRRLLRGAPALSPSASADWGAPLYVRSQGAWNGKAPATAGMDENTRCCIVSPDGLVPTCQGSRSGEGPNRGMWRRADYKHTAARATCGRWDCVRRASAAAPSRLRPTASDASRAAAAAAQRALARPPASWHPCSPALSAPAHLCRRRRLPAGGRAGPAAPQHPRPPSSRAPAAHNTPPRSCGQERVPVRADGRAFGARCAWPCRVLARRQGLCHGARLGRRQREVWAGEARLWLRRAARYQNL